MSPAPIRSAEPADDLGREEQRQIEQIRALQQQVEASERQRLQLEGRLEEIVHSFSWRLTLPLRDAAAWCRRVAARASGPALARAPARALHKLRRALRPAPGGAGPLGRGAPLPGRLSSGLPSGPERAGSPLEPVATAALNAFLSSDATLVLPTSSVPELSIVVVLYNRAELTLACLRSLAEHHELSFELIVVDNASTDATSLLLRRTRGARVVHNACNLHFLLGVNQAAKLARGRQLLILNNDTQVLPGSIASARRSLDAAPDVGAVGGKLVRMDGSLQEAGSILWRDGSSLGYGRDDDPFAPQYMFERNADYCSAAFLLTHRRLFEELGGFDEAYAPAYYEDVDYCLRVRKRGLRVVYDPKAVILHHESASAASRHEPFELTLAHRRILLERHRQVLERQLPAQPASVLQARRADARGPKTLLIEDRVPQPSLGSGFPRSRLVIEALLRRGHSLTLYPTAVPNEAWSVVYQQLPRSVEVMLGYGPDGLEDFLRERRGYYDQIIVSRPHNMERLVPLLRQHPDWFASTRVIYDAEACFALREIGRRGVGGETVPAAEARQLLGEEAALARAADVVVSVSEQERQAFVEHGARRAVVLGHGVEVCPGPRRFDERSGFLFVGAVHDDASPNADAIRWFVEEILPRLEALLGSAARLTVAGFNGGASIRRLASDAVRITGSLDDLSELYDESRVFVAPTRFAAGIPLKVIEAAARGIPVVATPLLAEQLGWRDGELLVGDGADCFASRCAALYQSRESWESVRSAALARARADWSLPLFESQLDAVLAEAGA